MRRLRGPWGRFLSALAGVLAAYALYARLAIPWIEGPPKRIRETALVSADIHSQSPDLSRWLPAGAWELQPCKRLDTAAGHLLFQDYQPHDDGRVEVRPLTILYRAAGDPPEAPQIVLRAPQGAVLKFDAPLNLSAKTGQLEGGMLFGPVEIYRQASAPDRRDDWRVLTSEVQLTNERIQTLQDVEFQFGPNVGRGRHLIVTLERDPLRAGQKTMAAVRGAARIELVKIAEMRLEVDEAPAATPSDASSPPLALGGVPARNPPSSPQAPAVESTTATPKAPPTLYRVTAAGPLVIDVTSGLASLNQQVEMISLADPRDWMKADRLEIAFSGGALSNSTDQANDTGVEPSDPRAPQPKSWSVQSVAVVGQPAQINFPSHRVTVLGERLAYDFARDTVRIENTVPQPLRQENLELMASDVEYRRMEDGSIGPTTIRGPGRLVQTSDPDQPPMVVAWQQGLSIEVQGEQRKLTVLGKVVANFGPTIALETDQIELWFRQGKPAGTGAAAVDLVKLIATGQVHVTADRLDVRVEQLLAYWPAPIEAGVGGDAGSGAQSLRAAVARSDYVGATPQEAVRAATSVSPAREDSNAPAALSNSSLPLANPPKPGGVPLWVRGQVATIRFAAKPLLAARTVDGAPTSSTESSSALGGSAAAVQFDEITIDGNVLLQQRNPLNQEAELQIEGNQLKVVPQDAEHRRAVVQGAPDRPMIITAAGMTMSGAQVTVDQKANRLWIDGAGNLQGALAGELASLASGGARSQETPLPAAAVDAGVAAAPAEIVRQLALAWEGGMVFDGRQVYFESGVVATIDEPAESGLVRTRVECAALNLTLEDQLDFSGAGESASAGGSTMAATRVESITLAREISADQRVFPQVAAGGDPEARRSILERQVFDSQATLQQLQRFDVPWLQVQVRSGGVRSNGPGALTAWMPASQLGQNLQSTLPSSDRPAAGASAWGNTQIKFDREIEGDLERSDLTFRGNVRVIYGSVGGTDESLDADVSQLSTGRYRLRADELRVVQWQRSTAAEPHLEMIAQGQLQLEGELFSALAQRLSFDQAREILVLEGDARNQARLEYQTAPGAPRNPLVAAKIKYRLRDQAAEAEGITHGVLSTGPLFERK